MKSFETIANDLQRVLPQDWKKVIYFAEVNEDGYEMFYYVFTSDTEKSFVRISSPV